MADEARRLTDLSAVKLALLARQARQRLDESGVGAAEPIAVVGMGCRFPGGADDPAKFWRLLADRGDAIREVPGDRWPVDALYDPDAGAPGKMTTRWGGFLSAIDGFDPQFFGISPREAARMDPQQRLLLEVAWEALEDAGQTRAGLDGSAAGVFVASYHNDYARLLTADRRDIDAWTSTGTAHSIVANRLSYLLNLRGPSLTVDTACSASLVAVHLACRSLRAEECSLAVAGGVSLMLSPEVTISLSKWGFMAADGRCKTFDAKADGFVRGEGCGVVVLKRLSDALADGDRILGLIRGTAVNQDGRTTVLTAPSGLAQAAVIRQALEDGKVAPDQVDYVEAHGTGTVLGDPIEVEALAEMYGKPLVSGHPCVLGAVKANIGHLEAAAGIAGLIKALLCLQHASIPPQCHFTQLNPHLSLEGSRLVIPSEAIAWPRGGRRRLAGVSSFGFGGTNAHVVLEEAPELSVQPAPGATPDEVYLLPLSAHREDALIARAESLRAWLESDEVSSVADVCYTAAVRRSHHLHRLAVVGSTAPDLARQLTMHLETGEAPPASDRAPRVAFVFSGQGTQRPGMGLELFERRAEFRAALEECDAAIRLHAGWSVIDALRADPSRSQVHRTEVAQPVIFAVQVALARLWDAWGVRPEGVCGHSVGEIAAAFVAGALTLDDAARIAVERGRVMERVTGKGRMIAVNLPASEIEDLLTDDLGLAAVNGPRSAVLSGAPRAVEEAARRLTERKVRHHVLPVDYAFHSAQLDPLREELVRALSPIRPRPARSALFSTVSGRAVDGSELDARYWATGIRAPVLFASAIDALTGDAETVLVEIGGQPALGAPILESLAARHSHGTVVSSLRRDRAELAMMLTGLGALYRSGVDVQWDRLYPSGGRGVALPAYPWQRHRYWHVPSGADAASAGTSEPALHPLVHRRVPSPVATLHESRLRGETPRYLGDHRIQGATILPATGYIEMALMVGDGSPVEDLVITAPLHVPDGEERLVQIVLGEGRTMQVYSATSGPEPSWTLHATARLDSAPAPPDAGWASPPAETADPASHYASLEASGLDFGSAFRGVVALWRAADYARGHITAPAAIAADLASHRFHPALMDACLQVIGVAAGDRMQGRLYLPFGVDRIVLHRVPPATLVSEARIRPGTGDVLVADVRVQDEAGRPVADLEGVRLKRIEGTVGAGPDEAILTIQWRPQRRPAAGVAPAREWLVLGGRGGLGATLRARLEAAGDRATLIGPDDSLDEPCRRWLEPGDRGFRGVVYLRGVDATVPADSGELVAAGRPAVEGLLATIRALAVRSDRQPPRLWVVTARAQATLAEDLVEGLPQAALWGVARVAALEHPELRCGRIDIDEVEPGVACLDALVAEIRGADAEDQVAFRDGERFVARLTPVAAVDQPTDRVVGASVELTIAERGTFERLEWRPVSRRAPGLEEIEIEVAASGLNFRDVLNALGAYPGDPGPLGGECAGRVVAVGSDVAAFRIGDTVAAVTPGGGFRTFVTVPASLAALVPATLSVEDAAATPIAFLTTLYGLERLARMGPGDRVLIHAAAGGVGLAAVQLALRAGATVFATVGSERKRRRLASLGVSHIMSSRSLEFAREVMERTDGRGVDIVLNSLAGEFIPASLSALAPGGRFIELGKTGIWDAERVRRHRADVSYWAVYLGDLFQREPALVGSMLGRILADLESGALRRLPRRTFARSDAAAAFRFMAQARHVGKLVLADTHAERRPALAPAAAYLVTGGLGALGIEVARWMVECGARHLVLLGRATPADRALAVLAELRDAGARVDVVTADVADRAEMGRVLRDLAGTGSPLRGVVHAAGIVDDGVLVEQSWDRVASVLRPKVEGGWILHELTRDLDLDFFVLFSSAAATLGSAGQAGYAAANACLDALAHHRRALGLPAVSIAWGRWALGMAAAVDDRDRARWARQGIRVIELARGLDALGRAMGGPQAHVMVSPTDWDVYAAQTGAPRSLLSELTGRRAPVAASAPSSVETTLLTRIHDAPPAGRRRLLIAHVQAEAAKVLALDGSRAIGVSQGLRDLGLDSLMAVELRNRLQASVGRSLPSTLAFDHPTVEAIADFLGEVLEVATGSGIPNGAARSSVELAVEALSDEEAEALLQQELSEIDARKGERR
jgi:acyl transferase domain-containing protein/acyl carrier protein